MHLQFAREINFRCSLQRLAQNGSFDFELVLIIDVLILASATTLKIGASRFNPVLRRLTHPFESRACKPWLLLSQLRFDLLAIKHEWHEYSFAWPAVIGRQ